MNQLKEIILKAQQLFNQRLRTMLETGGLTEDRYARFLTMQYHLTKGVQRHFLLIAANPATAKKQALRKWLIRFAQEEEFHFEIAKQDLKAMNREPGAMPFDTQIWWLYFNSNLEDRPFHRLGGTCILENIGEGSATLIDEMIKQQTYLNPKNLRFLTIHRHGPNLAHGDQVLAALEEAGLSESEMNDLIDGAQKATTMYLRFTHWVISGADIS